MASVFWKPYTSCMFRSNSPIKLQVSGPSPKRIVVLRALGLADMLCAVPAFRALRATFPNSEISLAGLPWAKTFVQRFPHYIDRFIEFPGSLGLPEQEAAMASFLMEMKNFHFDFAVQMHGSGSHANSVVRRFGARFCLYPADESDVRRPLKLLEFLGIPSRGEELEFPFYPKDFQEWTRLAKDYQLKRSEYVCVHPGPAANDRNWLPEQLARAADSLAQEGRTVVLTGTQQERDQTLEVQDKMKFPALNLVGETSLGALGALIENSQLLVSNEPSVLFMADALRTPSVKVTRERPQLPRNHQLQLELVQS